MNSTPNYRAAANVGFALVFEAEQHRPGTAQHDR
jgi:hypothetical protein